jgi:hypothetical protein
VVIKECNKHDLCMLCAHILCFFYSPMTAETASSMRCCGGSRCFVRDHARAYNFPHRTPPVFTGQTGNCFGILLECTSIQNLPKKNTIHERKSRHVVSLCAESRPRPLEMQTSCFFFFFSPAGIHIKFVFVKLGQVLYALCISQPCALCWHILLPCISCQFYSMAGLGYWTWFFSLFSVQEMRCHNTC